MFWYPVQRHRLDDIASLNPTSSISGSSSSTATASIRNPGVQKPHCRPWLSQNACCRG